MRIGIDASNLRAGGGVTHLVELLRAAEPQASGFEQVIVWGGSVTLSKIEPRGWLVKSYEPLLDKSLPHRVFWQRFRLRHLVTRTGCDVLFAPGGSDASGFQPMVTMSRNLLPFEWKELRRYGWSPMTLKLLALRVIQSRTFCRAAGVIFLTRYAQDAVVKVIGHVSGRVAMIPHGISPRFFLVPRRQRAPSEFSADQPCRVIYVSVIDKYKHQWHVAEAVARLRLEGVPIVLDLVGVPGRGLARLRQTLQRIDPGGAFVNYRGAVPYERLHSFYASADIGVFASSCENMPNILAEGMAAGLPMACSGLGPMPDMLGSAGVYFEPERIDRIVAALRQLIVSPDLRAELAAAAFQRAQSFSWERCATETFGFFAQVCGASQQSSPVDIPEQPMAVPRGN